MQAASQITDNIGLASAVSGFLSPIGSAGESPWKRRTGPLPDRVHAANRCLSSAHSAVAIGADQTSLTDAQRDVVAAAVTVVQSLVETDCWLAFIQGGGIGCLTEMLQVRVQPACSRHSTRSSLSRGGLLAVGRQTNRGGRRGRARQTAGDRRRGRAERRRAGACADGPWGGGLDRPAW